jgi:plasmid stabilization system protein ParE
VAQVVYAAQALKDIERLSDFAAAVDASFAARTGELILQAVAILEQHPLIGRPAEEDMRELMISRGRSGYVALYYHDTVTDTVIVSALRHQREMGYGALGAL